MHARPARRSRCEQIQDKQVRFAGRSFGAGCWCAGLPPLPRSGIAAALDGTHNLRRGLCFQAADELETLILADLCLEAMGYSPLTGEKLSPEESPELCSAVAWCNTVTARWNFKGQKFNPAGDHNQAEQEQRWTSKKLLSRIEERLIALISALPPPSLARAKAALALGLSYLQGVGRFRDDKATIRINCTSTLDEGRGFKRKLRRGRKALHVATQQLRIAEMLLFEATCVLEQHTAMEPVSLHQSYRNLT